MNIQGSGTTSTFRRRSYRFVLLRTMLLAAVALTAIWLWPGLPLVLQTMYSAVVGGVVLLIGLVWALVQTRGWARVVLLGSVVVLAAGAWTVYSLWGSREVAAPSVPEHVSLIDFSRWNCNRESCPVPTIVPGTIIGKDAPDGWSQLIFKIKPRCRPEEAGVLPSALVEATNRFFLTMAARAESQPNGASPRFILHSVGIGVGADCKARDRVTSSREANRPPELSGFLLRSALTALEKDISSSTVIARTPNLWIIDTPVRRADANGAHLITRRYAVWTDPRTGHVTSLYWDISRTSTETSQADEEKVYQLPSPLVEELPLVVNKGRSGFDALFALSRRPTASTFPLAVPWRAKLNDLPPEEPSIRLLEEEIARRSVEAEPREDRP